jgi:hypothetical protein
MYKTFGLSWVHDSWPAVIMWGTYIRWYAVHSASCANQQNGAVGGTTASRTRWSFWRHSGRPARTRSAIDMSSILPGCTQEQAHWHSKTHSPVSLCSRAIYNDTSAQLRRERRPDKFHLTNCRRWRISHGSSRLRSDTTWQLAVQSRVA